MTRKKKKKNAAKTRQKHRVIQSFDKCLVKIKMYVVWIDRERNRHANYRGAEGRASLSDRSRLAQLLLPEKHEEAHRHRKVHQQRQPKRRITQPWHRAGREIRKHGAGANFIRRRGPRQNGRNGAKDLSRDEGEEDVEARQGLQQYHAEPDPLHRVQDPEPKPQTPARDRGGGRTAGPGQVEADVGDAPEHLRPARGAEAHGEDGQDPRVGGGEEGEDVEEGGPDDDEEEDDEEADGPGGDVLGGPEVEPVAAVGCREPVILNDDHDEEPLGYCQ